MEYIPTFVRAGAFIPMAKGLKNTDDFDENKVSIHFYYHENLGVSNGIYFTDDGKTPTFNQSYQNKIEYFRYKKEGKSSTISFDQKSLGKIKPAAIRRYEMVLHNIESAPKNTILDKKEIKFQFDKTSKTLIIIVNLEQTNSTLQINW
jgi:alpha-glucosidase (family GH31 glycosyl hydrolase)